MFDLALQNSECRSPLVSFVRRLLVKKNVEKKCFGIKRKVIEGGVSKVLLMKIAVFLLKFYRKHFNWLIVMFNLVCCFAVDTQEGNNQSCKTARQGPSIPTAETGS